jgi:hypothetical protein
LKPFTGTTIVFVESASYRIVEASHAYFYEERNDTLCEREFVTDFANRFGCEFVEQKGGEQLVSYTR